VSESRRFLTAEWRDLVIANYAVTPDLLTPLVPRGTTLDLWEGQALVSLVGFRFVGTRVLGVGVPGHRDFEEVNLRFYVRRRAGTEVRRAVVFVRELVPRRAIAWTARALYNEPYRALPMRHDIQARDRSRTVTYEWRERGGWCSLAAETRGPPQDLRTGSKAEFITEHFWGYTRQRDGGTIEYRVTHPRWQVWEAPVVHVAGDLRSTYGDAFATAMHGPPEDAFVAVGSPVTVFRPMRLDVASIDERER
jgi:uncharacterized protein YqjF (DUF2071 family)